MVNKKRNRAVRLFSNALQKETEYSSHISKIRLVTFSSMYRTSIEVGYLVDLDVIEMPIRA
jgi:hypothetical protein